jgi:basic membrane lipoprotein Med (substrate-binding protein (PBP1-ABC) superfamily)
MSMGGAFRCVALLVLGLWSASASAALKVALILPGSDTDKGWNQMAREGLDDIKKELRAQTKAVTNVKSSDFYTQISNFAEDGYDVIICHGGEFEKAAAQAARTYPKTKIIVGGCPVDVKGATAVEFMTRDASELVGVVAARVSKGRKAAFVGAMKVGPLEACYDGMVAGAKAINNGTEVLPALWTNSWDSPILARESTENAMNAGADVIYQNVDAAAIGVFQAVQARNKSGRAAYAFGCNSNQNALAPDVILGSVVIDVPRAYLDLVKEAAAGKVGGGARKLGLKGGYVDLVLNEKHPAVTAEVRRAVEERRKALVEEAK